MKQVLQREYNTPKRLPDGYEEVEELHPRISRRVETSATRLSSWIQTQTSSVDLKKG
ncbi:MAG: hypothetical protein ACO2PN_28655 [Pyrobaculum sp.]